MKRVGQKFQILDILYRFGSKVILCKMITLWYTYQKLLNVEHHHCISMPGPIKKQIFHNISFLPHFSLIKVFVIIVLVRWLFRKNILKIENFDLGSSHIFACNSKPCTFTAKCFIQSCWEKHTSLQQNLACSWIQWNYNLCPWGEPFQFLAHRLEIIHSSCKQMDQGLNIVCNICSDLWYAHFWSTFSCPNS